MQILQPRLRNGKLRLALLHRLNVRGRRSGRLNHLLFNPGLLLSVVPPPRQLPFFGLYRQGLRGLDVVLNGLPAFHIVWHTFFDTASSLGGGLGFHVVLEEEFFGLPFFVAHAFELLGFGAQLFALLRCPEELAAQELEEFGCRTLELFGAEFDVRWELDECWGGWVGEVLQVDDVVVRVVGV